MRERMREHASKLVAVVGACLLSVAFCLCMAACSDSGQSQVAATIMGQEITEDEVTSYIETFRKGISCTDDQAWAEYMASRGSTPESVRTTTIYELAAPIVVKAKADEEGISVDDDAVQAQIDGIKSSLLMTSDDAWQSELDRMGTTQDDLWERYANKNLEEQVFEKVAGNIEPTEKDVRNYVEANLLGQTAKKIEVVFGNDYTSMQKAQDDARAAKTGRAGMTKIEKRAGDAKKTHARKLGWDFAAELTSNMKSNIADIKKGQVGDTLLSEDGTYYLFYVSDTYTFPKKASAYEPKDRAMAKAVRKLARESLRQSAGSVWLQQQIESGIQINDMPSGLSYDVDMSGTASSGQSAEASSASSEAAG